MKNILLSLSVLAILVLPACNKSDNSTTTYASVMFVNGCTSSANVNVSINVNGTTEGAVNDMAFLGNAGYQSVPAGGSVGMTYTLTGSSLPLTSGSATLTAGASYSVFAAGSVTGPAFVFATDDLTAPITGDAKVRFINLSSDSLNVSCYIGSAKLDSNVSYLACTSFAQVVATNANVLFQDPAHPTSLAQLSNQGFAAGGIYTIMLTGTHLGTGVSALTLTVINN